MDIEIVESLDEFYIPKINKEGKSIHLTSLYNTRREINKLVKMLEYYDLNDTVVIFGISYMEYIPYIKRFLKDNIYIVEPIDELRELAKKELGKNINILSVEEVCYFTFVNKIVDKKAHLLPYGMYQVTFKDEYNSIIESLKEKVTQKLVTENTYALSRYSWIKNCFSNLFHAATNYTIDRLKAKYKNKPAIIVSAGPSLEKTIPELKNLDDNFVIISGGRTLKTLKNNNIHCDYTCTIDAGDISYDIIEEALDYDTNMVFTDITNSRILDEFQGDKFYYLSREMNFINKKIINDQKDYIFTGSSVAHTCLGLAVLMGCSPIIMIGQDLAFPNSKLHADNASIASEKNSVGPTRIMVEDVFGGQVPTNEAYFGFMRQIEYYIDFCINNIKGIEFINCSPGGAKIKGAEYRDFREVISNYKNTDIDINSIESDNRLDYNRIYNITVNFKNYLIELDKAEKFLNKYKVLCDELVSNFDKYTSFNIEEITDNIRKVGRIIDNSIISLIIQFLNSGKKKEFKKVMFNGNKEDILGDIGKKRDVIESYFNEIQFIRNKVNELILRLEGVLEDGRV